MLEQDIPDPIIRRWYKSQQANQETIAPPSILQVELTKNCNNACIMCHKGQMASGKDFNRSDISDMVIQQLKPVYPYLQYAMLFGDGEPILYKGFWQVVEDIYKVSPGCAIDFINNGSLLNAVNVQKCLDYRVAHIGVSMGGATAETHNYIRKLSDFDRVLKNLEHLRDEKQRIGSYRPYLTGYIVVMKSNYQELPDFVSLCERLGFVGLTCQQLFVTHPSMDSEVISSEEVEPYFKKASLVSKKHGLQFTHYPLTSKNKYHTKISGKKINTKDSYFYSKYTYHGKGYCSQEQPWNTVYVLHDGRVVPDCHWWTSVNKTHLNDCGVLSKDQDILDIWNGPKYQEIRGSIERGEILPQCRGCGLAGGVRDKYRCEATDHTNPNAEKGSNEKIKVNLPVLQGVVVQPNFKNLMNWHKNVHNHPGLTDFHLSRIAKFNENFDYIAWLSNLYECYKERQDGAIYLQSYPIYLDIELHNECNFHCIHCESAMLKRGQYLKKEDIDKFLNMVPYAEIMEISKIAEPFIFPQETIDFLVKCRKLNPILTMKVTTNGSTLTPDIANQLIDLEFDQLSVSIDADTKEGFEKFRLKSNFNEVLSNMKMVNSIKKKRNSEYPFIHVSSQVNSGSYMPNIVEIAKDFGAGSIWFGPAIVFDLNETRYGLSKITTDYYDTHSQKIEEQFALCEILCKEYGISFSHGAFPGIIQRAVGFSSVNKPTISGKYDIDAVCPTDDPWYRFCLNPTGSVSPCCFHPPFESIDKHNMWQLRNHDFLVDLRSKIVSGIKGEKCFCSTKKCPKSKKRSTLNFPIMLTEQCVSRQFG